MSASTKWKATLTVLATILAMAATFFVWGFRNEREELRQHLAEHAAYIKNHLDFAARSTYEPYRHRIQNLAVTQPAVAEAFARRDRERLLQLVAPLFQQILHRENPHFEKLHFHTPDNRSFLRVHAPARFGDDLAATRPMVVEANRTRQQQAGYELSSEGLFYRVVQPLAHNGQHVGTVEFGIKVHELLSLMGEEQGVDIALLIDPAAAPATGEKVGADQHFLYFSDALLLKCRENLFDELPPDFSFLGGPERFQHKGRWYQIDSRTVLADYRGRPVARVLFTADITDYIQGFQRVLLVGVVITCLVVLVAFLVLHSAFARLNRELVHLNAALEEKAGELGRSYAELEVYRHKLENVIVERTVDLARTNEDLVRQIAEKERIEQDLRRSQSNLAKAQQVARLGHWEWLVPRNLMVYSDQAIRIFGMEGEELTYTPEGVLRYIHPEDLEMVRGAMEAVLQQQGDSFQVEFRIIRPDGKTRHMRSEAELTRDAKGRPLRMFGTVQDISESRKATEELHLAANVFESSIEGIVITDPEGTIEKVNRAFTEITGYTEAEALGQNPRLLKSDRHDQAFYAAMWQALIREGKWQGEVWNRRKNGEVYPQWLTITAIRDGKRRLTHYAGVFHDMTAIKVHEERLRYQAHHDALTALPNRVLFRERLGLAMGYAQRHETRLALLFLDLDNFKRINDSLGHTVGDLLLKEVAGRLRHCVREKDTVARHGGDEFIVLLEGIEHEDDAVQAAHRITRAIEPPFALQEQQLYLSASIGIAYYPEDGTDHDTLIRNADTAMYRAKEEGRNTFQIFTPSMSQRVSDWLAVENSLRKALERREFFLHYQPKIDLVSGRIVGAEALVRWKNAQGELVSPRDFIPLAEDSGLVVAIGEWVMEQACRDARKWCDQGFRIQVSVNLSPRQFRQEDLVDVVAATLQKTGLPTECLAFEITESTVMDNEQKALGVLGRFQEMGISLAVDDFGTGYSSLYYLKHLPIDELKIDRRFIRDLPGHEDDCAITAAIISMAKSLKLTVVAEGVEEREQLAFLREHGCEQMQGYLFSPPVPYDELIAMLAADRRLQLPDSTEAGQRFLPFDA
ncbi:MAG: EAL domain-containing protein [Thermodesulfobacteriota bacterium]